MHAQNLVADPVVDPNEPEPMTGVPVTRTSSLDGRWAYTLYDSQEHPFVHALDTARRTAVCIDLDDLPRAWGSSLELHGPRLDVVGPAGRIGATINTRTHRLVEPPAARPRTPARHGCSPQPRRRCCCLRRSADGSGANAP